MTEPDEPPPGEAKAAEAPNMRTFSLNSDEAHQALCRPQERPWIEAGSLPREPRGRPRAVVREG